MLTSDFVAADTWNARWRGRLDQPANVDVILRISRNKPAFFSWGGGRIGIFNVYVEATPQRFRFATSQGADITLTPKGNGSVAFRYWSQWNGEATGTLYNTPCKRIGPRGRCLDP